MTNPDPPFTSAQVKALIEWPTHHFACTACGAFYMRGGRTISTTEHTSGCKVAERNAALLAYAAALEQPGATWQPMETAPKDREILLWWPYWSARATVAYWKHDRWIAENALSLDGDPPLGWLPLPAPPTTPGGRG